MVRIYSWVIFIPDHQHIDRNFCFVFCGKILHWCRWLDNIHLSFSVSLVVHKQGWPLIWVHTFLFLFSKIWNLLKVSLWYYTVFSFLPGITCNGLTCMLTCPWWYKKRSLLCHSSWIKLLLLHLISHCWQKN